MNNLFSVFDPNSLMHLPLNWASSLFLLSVTPPLFWLAKSQAYHTLYSVLKFIHGEFLAIMGVNSSPGMTFSALSLFLFIGLNNFFGLAPYIFTSSSHLTFSVAMALPLWLGHTVFSWLRQPANMLAHLVPLGTPYPLMPFMVLIELISSLIRPLTLSVRLAANMVAGHLLLTLISSIIPATNWAITFLVISGVVLLGVLESAVALIQAYVFSVLMALYLQEVNSPSLY